MPSIQSSEELLAQLEELKLQLDQSKKEAARLRGILDVLPDHIMLLDEAGSILDINHTVASLSVAGVIGTLVYDYIDKRFHAEVANCLEHVWATGEASSYRTNFTDPDGNTQIFETKVALLVENGERVGLLAESRDITELNEALQSFRAKSEALDRSQELANIGSWELEIESGKLVWTDQVFRIFGFPPADFKATYEAFLEAIHPDDREMVNRAYSLAVKNNTPYNVVHRVLRPDGTVRVVRETSEDFLDDSGSVVRSMGIVHDITEQHTVQRTLEEKERFLSTLLANIPGMVYRCQNTPDWPMEYLSEGCLELTGYQPSELLSPSKRTFGSLVHPDDTSTVWDTVQEALQKKTFFEATYRITTADNTTRLVWERGRGIYDEKGELKALEGFLTDFSNIEEEQQNRLKLERVIMKNQKLESLGLMAGGIAHDFNNLLTIILGNAEMALSDLSGHSPIREFLEKIELASQRAADLAHQMLAYAGQSQFESGVICLNDLLSEMALMMEVSISRAGALDLKLCNNVPGFEGDVTQVRQVVMNLISNAAEAVEDGHGTIVVASGTMFCDRQFIDQSCATHLMMYSKPIPEGEYAFIEVTDTGSGMDQTLQDRIFDPFFTTKFTGRGLGLAATLGIIRGHRGTLLVQSELGKGTSFKVLFPCERVMTGAENVPELKCTQDSWRGEGLILLADDEEMVLGLGKKMLERQGFEVITAADGQQAVDTFTKHADEIILVLLDLTMPVLNGEEVFQKIKAIKPQTKVVLCTGFTENATSLGVKDGDLAGYLHKPYTNADLQQVIRTALA